MPRPTLRLPEFNMDLINLVQFDPSVGKFRLNVDWSPAYSGHNNAQRVRQFRKLSDSVQRFRTEDALQRMIVAGHKDYKAVKTKDGRYRLPNSGDPDWDVKRIEADYLDFQVKNQAKTLEDLAKEAGKKEPGGWRGVVHDALDNPGGSLILRGLDLASRPAYAGAEGYSRLLSNIKGESQEHPGWAPAPIKEAQGIAGPQKDPSKLKGGPGWWRNRKTGEYLYRPDWKEPGSNLDAFLGGAREGITGREKTGWGEVLREQDILEGKPAAAAGFGMDILLDPASYVSFGTSSVAKKGGKALSATERVAMEDIARATAREAVEKSGKTGLRATLAERGAFKKALKEQFELAGVSRRPVKEVIKDINSSYGPHSVERSMKDKVTEAMRDPFWKPKVQRGIAKAAREDYRAIQATLGEAVDPKRLKQVGIEALQKARKEFADKVGADVLDEIATRKALRENVELELKVGGRRVVGSAKAGRALAKTSAVARETRPGRLLARTFRTDAEIGEALHRIQRQNLNVSASQFEEEAKEVKKIFSELGLSKKQRKLVSRAVESGDTKGFTTQMVEAVDQARSFMQRAFDREVEAGALSPTDFKDNYLYHVYKEPNFKRGIGSWVKPTGRGAKKFRTLDEAVSAGARPLEDIADILVYRLAKSHRIASSHNMMRTIATRFGISNIAGKRITSRMLKNIEDEGILVEGRKIAGAGKYFAPGVYFDQDVAASLSKMTQIFSSDELISRFGRLFDQFQARVKFLQTAPNPGFHVRNTMSDMFMNFLDGVTSIAPYRQATELVGGRGKGIKIYLKSGKALTGEEILQLYDGMGLRAGFFHAEAGIIPGMGSRLTHGTNNVVRRVSELREDTMRMAHFIDALKKTPSTDNIEEAAELAAKRVRKYNFDYQDLTSVEKKVFRRAVPFYTFMRKNVPLMLETYFTRPGRMTVPTKAQNALAAFLGNDNRDEPLPGMVSSTPEWMARFPGVELSEVGPENDPIFMQPDLPYNQVEQLFGGFAKGGSLTDKLQSGTQGLLKEILLEQSTPLLRTAAEYGTQTDLSTGADQPQTPFDAVVNQLPVGRIAQPALAQLAPGQFTRSDRPGSPRYDIDGAEVPENLLNWVTGLGFRRVTPERQKSELRRRQDIIEALIDQMKAALAEQYEEDWKQYGT